MLEIVVESALSLVLLLICLRVAWEDRGVEHQRKGWLFIRYGFVLVFIGSLVDLFDSIEYFKDMVFLGPSPAQMVLEHIIGYLGGFVLLATGLWMWLPEVQKTSEVRRELQSISRQYEFVFKNSPFGMVRGKVGTLDVERNQAFADMLGYDSPEEIHALAIANGGPEFLFKDPEQSKRIRARLKREQIVKNAEAIFRHKDGSDVWLCVDYVSVSSVTPDYDGDKDYVYTFVRDITLEKKAGMALAESEERLKTIINVMPVGVYLVELPSQRVVQANPACVQMLGRTHGEVVGTHCCDVICPNKDEMCPFVGTGLKTRSHEGVFTRRDGTNFPVMKSVSRMTFQGHDYLLETFVDISEQKRLESLKEDVDRIMRHDLRSPVANVVSAATYSLLDETVQGETREMFENIKKQGLRILDMLGLSMALYKIESGTYESEQTLVNLADLIRELVAELCEALNRDASDVVVRFVGEELDEDAVFNLFGDRMLLRSLIANLLTNAMEASPLGQAVTLDVETGHGISLTFINAGVVPLDVRSVFFEKYATSGKSSGTGLGTYTANLIVRNLGGSIDMKTLDSEDRTILTVRLPVDLV